MKHASLLVTPILALALLCSLRIPLSAEEPVAADPASPALTLWQLPNQTSTQMMSYVMKADDGSVIVIDGGNAGDAPYLAERIRAARPDGKVAAWFLTHLHSDHVNALCRLMTETPDAVSVDCVYFHFPTMEWFEKNCARGEQNDAKHFFDTLPAFSKTAVCLPGETWTFGSVTIECLNDFDPAITANPVNNTSILYRVATPKTSILFLGDLGVEGGRRVMEKVSAEKLKADWLQMAHHGQNGVDREFYERVRPTVCLWPTPDWLWNNNQGKGDDTGPYNTISVRAWVHEMGVKEHHVMKDGLAEFRLD